MSWFQAQPDWLAVRSAVTPAGECTVCQQTLESVELDPVSHEALVAAVEEYLADAVCLLEFKKWLHERGRVDVVIDGLNIAHLQCPGFNIGQLLDAIHHFRVYSGVVSAKKEETQIRSARQHKNWIETGEEKRKKIKVECVKARLKKEREKARRFEREPESVVGR